MRPIHVSFRFSSVVPASTIESNDMTRTLWRVILGLMLMSAAGAGRPFAAAGDALGISEVRSVSPQGTVNSLPPLGKRYAGRTIEGRQPQSLEWGPALAGDVMHLELDSAVGDDVAFGDVQDNGTWS
jgi:hypothetical protein